MQETVKIWSTELQASCVRSNILLSKQQALVKASRDYKEDVDEELDPVLDGVSKVRIITEDEPNFIKRDSLREKCEQVAPIQVTSPSVTIPRNTQAVVTNDRIMDDTVLTGTSVVVHSEKNIREVTMGMEELVVDNYFHSVATNKYDPVDEKNGAEYEAQWIAQYDYGDEESNCSFEPYEEEDNKTVENVLEGRTHQAFDDRRKPIDDDSDRESEAENEFDLSSGVRHSKPEKMEYELQYMQSSKLLPGVSSPQDIGNTAAFESIESVFDPSSLSELYSYYQQQKEDGDDEKNYSDGDGSNVGADEEGGYESRYEPNSDDGSSGRDHDEEDNYDDDEYEEYTDSSPRSDGKENSLSPKKEEINQGFRFDEPETGFVEKTAEQVLTERNMVGIENNKEVQNVIPDERDKVLFTNASQWPVEVQRELEELDKAWEVDELTTAPNLTPRNSDSYVSSRQVSSELVKTEEVADDFNVFGQKAQWYVPEEEVKVESYFSYSS